MTRENIREPAVAGRFYPDDVMELARQVTGYLEAGAADGPRLHACAVMVPHAGYVYSGGVAGRVFGRVRVPERVVVLCPNHTGRGRRVAVWESGKFSLPGLNVPIDTYLAEAIMEEYPGAEPDRDAHRREHAIEVELPFLAVRQVELEIVPIVLGHLTEAEAIELGRAIWRAADRFGGGIMVVASSDMSHYLPDRVARRTDRVALEPLLAFDPGGLYRTVVKHDISMCGFIPATVMLSYARRARAQDPELAAYATSGDAFGDRDAVVGYAGVIVPA